MERLEKLINILKLTPHRQPELVKEATHRILSRSIRTNPQACCYIKPLIEILIQYCDTDDSSQRSLFNDHLNSVILAFQNQSYTLILTVLIDVVVVNGSARSVTAALQRISHLINNVQPTELDCDAQKLIKALIEVSRRKSDESVLRSLDLTLKQVMPYIDYYVRKSKEMQLLSNSLVEVISRNLQEDSSQVKRIAASSISTIYINSELLSQNISNKLKDQLDSLLHTYESGQTITNKFIGLCMCIREVPDLIKELQPDILKLILQQLKRKTHEDLIDTTPLEIMRELLKYELDDQALCECARLVLDRFLIIEQDGSKKRREDVKVTLQSNALACFASIITQVPRLLDKHEYILEFRYHPDAAVRNQVINIIGNYINASWKFPSCVQETVDCERIRKLWVELRDILKYDNSNPDVLKACVVAIKTCALTLLESDHCLHIIEHHDFEELIQLYHRSNFKPLKLEIIGLFAKLNYRTLSYLEKFHWSKMKSEVAGSYIENLQEKILSKVLVAALVDDHQRIRAAAALAIVTIIPNLYITNLKNGHKSIFYRTTDPIVSLAHDFASEHLIVLKQADEHINHFGGDVRFDVGSEAHEKSCIRNDHKFISSSIIQSHDNPYNEQTQSLTDVVKSQHRVNIAMNLMSIINLLKNCLENNIEKGKVAISSIVRTLYELSLVYPVYQYSASWDCRASEYCECFTLLNFLLTYMENLVEPDVVVEDLEVYKSFLALTHQLLYALCHESVITDYEHQKMKPFHKRQAEAREGYWSELKIKHSSIADVLDTYFTHLTKLLSSMTLIIEEKNNPFTSPPSTKQLSPVKNPQTKIQHLEPAVMHKNLMSSTILFARIFKKLESSLRSSRRNLNFKDEKFYQILEQCLTSLSALFEFIGMQRSIEHVRDILSYLKITSPFCGTSSLICARQLLKSVFGINILALYQVDPHDWFEEDPWTLSTGLPPTLESTTSPLQGVYHHLMSNPYKIFSSYCSINFSELTPTSDKALAIMNFESRRALKVRRRIEDRVKSLFEFNPQQLVSPKTRHLSEMLKNTIIEFTPIVTECMTQFMSKGFNHYQSETLHFMSYLILLRVNFQKLALANDLVNSINKLLDQCGERVFRYRESNIENFLRNSFTFLTLLSHEREFSKPMFPVATVIQKLDDVRAKLSMSVTSERDVTTYVVPLLRCLVEDLFIYRTKDFRDAFASRDSKVHDLPEGSMIEMTEQDKKDEILEAERETVAQKLIDVIDNPRVYDLLSILVQESRSNSSEIKYKKLSQHLLTIIPSMLAQRKVNLLDYRCIELTRRIIESISPEVFNPVRFIIETLLEAPKPMPKQELITGVEFQRWMSLVIISMHILITQVKEEVFLSRLKESMSDEVFVEYLLHIAQLCIAEIIGCLSSPLSTTEDPKISFLVQQLSSYFLYLTRMFQSGLFFQLSRRAVEFIKKEVDQKRECPKSFSRLYRWSRDPSNGFSLSACEQLFYNVRLVYPDLTIFWCNIMMLLNSVDCNRDFWRDLLVYECHHCQVGCVAKSVEGIVLNQDSAVTDDVSLQPAESVQFRRSVHVNRPSSLNLSEISFNDQLRRSFIKRIATSEPKDKAFNRNIVASSDRDGRLMELETNSGNTEQCLSPNIELARRGVLCLVLDFVTISMNDVEHITWLIIHHINDIIRWSHETPITEFITSVHGNSASSGIFIHAINNGFNNLNSLTNVSRVLWTLQQVHYTQYGSLVVLMVEKLLSSPDLIPYRSITRKIEDFACETVQKLINETNKSLAATSDEVVNQLTVEDLDRTISLLDGELYPKLTSLLVELREKSCGHMDLPKIELHSLDNPSDSDSDMDEIEILYTKADLVYWLAEQNCTTHILSLIPALNIIKKSLSDPLLVERVNKDELLVCYLISAIYSLALNVLPPPARLSRPKFWSGPASLGKEQKNESGCSEVSMSIVLGNSKRKTVNTPDLDQKILFSRNKSNLSPEELTDSIRTACLKLLFLLENLQLLKMAQYQHLEELIIRLARIPLINAFVLTPPILWRQNIWPTKLSDNDVHKINFPMVNHELLSNDPDLLDIFCDRLLSLGWTSRRQFEEAWMTLVGVLSSTLTPPPSLQDSNHDLKRKSNLRASCKAITTLTKLMLLTRRTVVGDPLASDTCCTQDFEERVIDLTKSIGTNLSSLQKRTKAIFESIEVERSVSKRRVKWEARSPILMSEYNDTGFSDFLKVSAQKIRMNVIINAEVDMQDIVVIDSDSSGLKSEDVDVESCIRLLLSIYRQKLADPNEVLTSSIAFDPGDKSSLSRQQQQTQNNSSSKSNRGTQIAPPLVTAISQSILALSDMFADYEQFEWMFDNFVQMFKQAEKNEDEIQMQYLIVGLCKSASICCYDMPNEVASTAAMNHKEVMFEKCRQTVEKCTKSDFGPLKRNALLGLFYMLEDSINIVASGAWELDQFKHLRQSRLSWIVRLMPIILDRNNCKILTKNDDIVSLLESLCEVVTVYETKFVKS